MKIVFDLDGVLRDLNGYLSTKYDIPYPQEWFWKHNGKDVFDWIAQDNLRAIAHAPTTDLYFIVKNCFEEIEIWTNQPENWRELTKVWIDVNFTEYGIKCDVKYLDNKEKRALLDTLPDTWLVEDNPLFTHWDRILLVDRPYNKHITDAVRIKGMEDFDRWIWKAIKQSEVKIERVHNGGYEG